MSVYEKWDFVEMATFDVPVFTCQQTRITDQHARKWTCVLYPLFMLVYEKWDFAEMASFDVLVFMF